VSTLDREAVEFVPPGSLGEPAVLREYVSVLQDVEPREKTWNGCTFRPTR